MATYFQNTVATSTMTCAFWANYGQCSRGDTCKYAHYHTQGMVVAGLPRRDARTGLSVAGRNLAMAEGRPFMPVLAQSQPQSMPIVAQQMVAAQTQAQATAAIAAQASAARSTAQTGGRAAAAVAKERAKRAAERAKWEWEHYRYMHRANEEFMARMEKEKKTKQSRWTILFEQDAVNREKRRKWTEEVEKEAAARRLSWVRETEKERLRGLQAWTRDVGRRIWEYRVLTPNQAQGHVQQGEEDVGPGLSSSPLAFPRACVIAEPSRSRSPSPSSSTTSIKTNRSASSRFLSGQTTPPTPPKSSSPSSPKIRTSSTTTPEEAAPSYTGRHRLTEDVVRRAAAELRHIPYWTGELFAEKCRVIMEREAMLEEMVDKLVSDDEDDCVGGVRLT